MEITQSRGEEKRANLQVPVEQTKSHENERSRGEEWVQKIHLAAAETSESCFKSLDCCQLKMTYHSTLVFASFPLACYFQFKFASEVVRWLLSGSFAPAKLKSPPRQPLEALLAC